MLNAEDTIGDCIVSLLRTDYPADRREILVVDNGSTDHTAEIVEQYPVTYLREERRGIARARNRGIVASRGEIVAFTDADCLATTGWLRELVNEFDGTDVGGVAGEILPFPPRTAAERYAARIRLLSPERYLSRPTFPFAVTANLAFRREVFDAVGLLDLAAPGGGESTDFCTRFFRGTGLQLRLARKAVVLHRHRSTVFDFLRQHWRYGRSHAYLYLKYREEVPWGWRQTVAVYRDLARAASKLGETAVRYGLRRVGKDELETAGFDFLSKLALRAGFLRQSLAHGRLYL